MLQLDKNCSLRNRTNVGQSILMVVMKCNVKHFMGFNWREIAQIDMANGGLGLMVMLMEITLGIKWNRSFMSRANATAAWQEEIITG